jgi:hypothetical protein
VNAAHLRKGLGPVLALLVMAWPAFGQGSMQTLLTNGPLARRINIVFLSEGYTTNQLPQFTTNARIILSNLLTTLPLREYSNYFNAFAISIPSNESGSDHPSRSIVRDTYFNSTYDSSGIARLITINGTGQSRVNSLLATFMPQYDIVALVVNDTEYGGSGGFPLIASVNGASAEIAIHELGHSFAGLGDEYTSAYPGYPDIEEPNTTRQTNRVSIKWNAWILTNTPIPTPDVSSNSTKVGLFEGAHYHTTDWFRPKHDCKMRTLNVAFCEVCAQTLVTSIYTQVRPIETNFPTTNTLIFLTNFAAVTLSVSNLAPSTHALSVQWFTNNVAVTGATSAVFAVTGFSLPPGTNDVRVDVRDLTAFVRTDPVMRLTESRNWRVRAVVTPPRLLATRAGSNLRISWATNASGFNLESQFAPGGAWSQVLSITSQTNLTVAPTNSRTWYRLRKP